MLYVMPTCIFPLHMDSLLKVTSLFVTHTMQDKENLTVVDKTKGFFVVGILTTIPQQKHYTSA